jgi:YidC/Oxa1 family membrane protein insertase
MMIAGIFEVPASVLAFFYSITTNYALAISMIAVLVMLLVTPLNLKSTKGMLEMQRLAPEMRKLQNQYKGDRQKLNEEMMELYKEHKVNPMASCLPLVAQMPVFIIMFRILQGMTYSPTGGDELVAQAVLDAGGDTRPVGFVPRYLSQGSELYQSLVRSETMTSFGLDLSKSAKEMLGIDFAKGLIYAALVVLLGLLYWVQQRMVASRAAVSPTMSPAQQKLMQYLPVAFAVFQVFFLLGLVVYYLVQTVLRIAQQYYITKRFYSGDESLGRQAQAASARARELAKEDGNGGQSAPSKRDQTVSRKGAKNDTPAAPSGPAPTKRTTPPKNRPTSTARQATNRPGGSRSGSKKRNG